MYQDLLDKKKTLAVIGLGYVGLPIALEFAKGCVNQSRKRRAPMGVTARFTAPNSVADFEPPGCKRSTTSRLRSESESNTR